MKITYLANSESIHTVRWARHFSRLGHDVAVLSFAGKMISGIRTTHLPASGLGPRVNLLGMLPRVRRLVRADPPDILHAHYVTSYGLAGALCSFHPFVATAWGDDVLIDPEKSLAYRLLVRWVLSRADLTTSMAGHMTRLMVKRGYAEPGRIMTLPFGVDTDQFNPSRRRIKSPGDGITVISTRHLEAEYHVETLVRAVPSVLSKLPATRFRIVGKGSLSASLKQLATALGAGNAVDFLGAVEHSVLSDMLGEADVFVSTSVSDGNNISLNEAMACGSLPVVSDIAANREWITEGRNGLFFPVGDSEKLAEQIIFAASQPEWRRQAAERNWEIIRDRGSWDKNMLCMEKAYEELLRRKIDNPAGSVS